MEDSAASQVDKKHAGVVPEFVSQEANDRKTNKDSEWEDAVDEANVNIADSNVLK